MLLAPTGAKPRRRARFGVLMLCFTGLFLVLEGRLFYLQIIRGATYRERARISVISEERIPPRRGRVKERKGRYLAKNKPVYSLTLTPHFLAEPEDRKDVSERLGTLLQSDTGSLERIDTLITDAFRRGRRWDAITLLKELKADEVPIIRSNLHDLPGIELETSFRRVYPFKYDAAHVLGYLSGVNQAERQKYQGVYGLHDLIGRTGIERSFEPTLRGHSGRALHIRDSDGHRTRSGLFDDLAIHDAFQASVSGHDVWLTLDIDLQKEVRQAFRYHKSGAAVVVNPVTGEILAMYSKPGFDPNLWSAGLSKEVWDEINENPYSPLINKAVTPYAPGSVYKIVTAVAALSEGVLTPDVTIECSGFYEYGGRRFHCHDRSGHGAVNLQKAVKVSCDVYFYRAGEMLGMENLAAYGKRFGFGLSAELDIAERLGLLPTRAWHETETTLGWQPGFMLSTAIGQGSLTATPLQVARSYSALVNGGYLLRMRLVDRVTNAEGELVHAFEPKIMSRLDVEPEILGMVREALVRVVNEPDGSAYASVMDELVMAGKTGTAEAAQVRAGASPELAIWLQEDHSWFAAYAPAEDPQVVVVVFLEHGGWGSKFAAPIAQRITRAWLRLGFQRTSSKPKTIPVMAAEE